MVMVIVTIPPIIMTIIRIMPTVVCIPIPDIHPVIVIGVIVKDVVGCRIDVDGITVIIHKPIVYSAIVLQIPINGT
jgi:hypothetical protein